MSNKTMIKLAENFSMPAVDYANQANAILGIRKYGKSFTAMKTAEELMDSGIPILVIDPIGIWKNMKIGLGKHKGYPIVVAGGEGSDIILTEYNCEEIVRAARKEGVSMVIDLHCRELATKSLWIRIVQKVVDLLMYENQPYGLLHVYLEEAAEFIPQRLQPQHSKVYAALESMARMGRNVGLGLTCINQRAEEINKAILEICDLSLLHRQVGKNSMLSVQKWLEVRQVEKAKDIIAQLPKLQPGECFVIGEDGEPFKIKVLPKNSFHPDPKKGNTTPAEKVAVDVSGFVSKMNKQLEKKAEKDPAKVSKALVRDHGAEKATAKIEQLSRMLQEKDDELAKYKSVAAKFMSLHKTASIAIDNIVEIAGKAHAKLIEEFQKDTFPVPGIRTIMHKSDNNVPNSSKSVQKIDTIVPRVAITNSDDAVSSGPLKYLKAAAMFYPGTISKKRMCAMAGTSFKKSTHRSYMAYLKQNELLELIDANTFKATEKGMEMAGEIEEIPSDTDGIIQMWCTKLSAGPGIYLRTLAEVYPKRITKDRLAEAANTDYTKSTHRAYMAELNACGLIDVKPEGIKASDELFN